MGCYVIEAAGAVELFSNALAFYIEIIEILNGMAIIYLFIETFIVPNTAKIKYGVYLVIFKLEPVKYVAVRLW